MENLEKVGNLILEFKALNGMEFDQKLGLGLEKILYPCNKSLKG